MRPCSGARSSRARPRGAWTFGFRPGQQGATRSPIRAGSGAGAHPDVHAIEFSGPAATSTVWVGCDGGIFQSAVVTPPPATGARGVARNTAVGPWRARNDGLAITQPTYLAQTPVSDSLMLAGTQDNGVEERIGPAAWKLVQYGDGGGCAIDPAHPNRRFAQWTHFPGTSRPTRRADYNQDPGLPIGQQDRLLANAWSRRMAAAFYSDRRGPGARPRRHRPRLRQLTGCGTARTGAPERRPRPAGAPCRPAPTRTSKRTDSGHPAPDLDQDSLHGPVIRVAFIDDNRLLVLTQVGGHQPDPGPPRCTCSPGRGRGGDPAAAEPARSRPPGARPAAGAQDRFPEGEIPVGLAVDDPGPGSCYVTLGVGQNSPEIDHVWWFDGSYWWPCGFDATVADPGERGRGRP